MNNHKDSAWQAIEELRESLVRKFEPFEGGVTYTKVGFLSDNRHFENNDILYNENYEGISAIRHRIREFSEFVDEREELKLLKCIEQLAEESELYEIPVEIDQDEVLGHIDVILSDSPVTIYLPERESLIVLPEVISTFSPEVMKYLADNPNLLYEISDRDFERLIAEIFSRNGYEVHLTAQTRDGGKDIVAFYRDRLGLRTKYIVECKRYAWSNPVDISIVQRLEGVRHSLDAHKAILATTSRFTKPAIDWAKAERNVWSLELKDHADIVTWLKSTK